MKREDYVKLVNAVIRQKNIEQTSGHSEPSVLLPAVLEYLEQETKDSNGKQFGSYLRCWVFGRPDAGLNAKEAWLNDKHGNRHYLPDAGSLFDYLMDE